MADNTGKIIHLTYDSKASGMEMDRYVEVPRPETDISQGGYRLAGYTVRYVLPDSKQAHLLAHAEVGDKPSLGTINTEVKGIYTAEEFIMKEALAEREAYENADWPVSVEAAVAAQEDTRVQRVMTKKGPKI